MSFGYRMVLGSLRAVGLCFGAFVSSLVLFEVGCCFIFGVVAFDFAGFFIAIEEDCISLTFSSSI